MVDLSIQALEKYYDEDHRILDGLTFDIQEGERVGLLGRNGAGKTTLFRILSGEIGYEGGTFALPKNKKLGVLDQLPKVPPEWRVEDVLTSAFDTLDRLREEMNRLEHQMAEDPSDRVMRQYAAVTARFEAAGGYETKQELGRVAAGLGITAAQRQQRFSDLSGGEQTRVNLARLILEKTDILLLDEPTNHLDLSAIVWLEEFLRRFKGTALIISHDRYFLDRVVTRIIELREGKAEFYSGNYSFYVEEKQRRYEEQLARYEQEQRKLKQLEATATRMHGWAQRNAKLHQRAFAIEKRMARISQTEKPKTETNLKSKFKELEFFGDEVVKARGLKKQYGEKLLFQDLDLDIQGGEHVALLGDNGAGKTTLLRILLGLEPPDEGFSRMGPSVKAAVMPQKIEFPDPDRTLLETVLYALNCSTQTARDRLGAFQFQGEDVFKVVRDLSGGERSRLWLCCVMAEGMNLLLLDEPTNHLDIASREWIEEAVDEFQGTLLFVSHDRYFIQRFAQRILEFRDGSIYDFKGGYDEYLEYRQREEQLLQSRRNEARAAVGEKAKPARPGGEERRRKKRLTELETQIAKTEQELERLGEEMEVHAQNFEKLQELLGEQERTQQVLDGLYEEWGALID